MHINNQNGIQTVNLNTGVAGIKLTCDASSFPQYRLEGHVFVMRDASVDASPGDLENTFRVCFYRDDDEGKVTVVLDREVAKELVTQLVCDFGLLDAKDKQ
jgi:hypothetical protein